MNTEQVKTGFKEYYNNHTAIVWRKIGDALLGVSTMITATSIAMEQHLIAYIALGIGVLGKFLTNLFKEDKDGQD